MQIGGLDSTIYELNQDHLSYFFTFSLRAYNCTMYIRCTPNDIIALKFKLV